MPPTYMDVTQPPSLADVLFSAIRRGGPMPAVIAEGALVNTPTIGAFVTSPSALRRFITNSHMEQRPLTNLLTQQAASTGASQAITFTPTNSAGTSFPGDWMQYIYGVLIEVDYQQTAAKSIIDVTVAGFDIFGVAVSLQAVTGQPNATPSGTAKVRLWIFPGEQTQGWAVYKPLAFMPALSGTGQLSTARNLVVTFAAGLSVGINLTVHLLTRGHAEVDNLVRLVSDADHVALAAGVSVARAAGARIQ